MDIIKDLLIVLEEKYTAPVVLIEALNKKYTFDFIKPEIVDVNKNKDDYSTHIILHNDTKFNYKFVIQLLDSIDNLINQLNLHKEDDLPLKIVEDYKVQLNKIAQKNLDSGEKVASSICKCVKKTILKLYNVKDYGYKILTYLKKNGFALESFTKGHMLSDDDLCFLDESLLQVYKEKTNIKEDNYKVIDMVQPIVKVFYYDEEEESSHFIPGICKYYFKEVER